AVQNPARFVQRRRTGRARLEALELGERSGRKTIEAGGRRLTVHEARTVLDGESSVLGLEGEAAEGLGPVLLGHVVPEHAALSGTRAVDYVKSLNARSGGVGSDREIAREFE